jgi:hypothetical protein
MEMTVIRSGNSRDRNEIGITVARSLVLEIGITVAKTRAGSEGGSSNWGRQ